MEDKRVVRLAAPLTGAAELEAIAESLTTGWLTQGPQTKGFESAFSRFHDNRYAVATSSGTTALHLALLVAGIGPDDEVIVPSYTWVASANAIRYTGATPVFADVDLHTYNCTAEDVASRVSTKTKAVVVVHQFGRCADVDAIAASVPETVRLIEDAATAIGARLRGRLAGTLADLAAFSFHPRKVLTTGEGGMVLTSNDDFAERARVLRNHGVDSSLPAGSGRLGEIRELGFNYRMSEMQAAMGIVQLSRLEDVIEERRQWAAWYQEQLSPLGWLQLPADQVDSEPVWQAYVVVVRPDAPLTRDELAEYLATRGIETRPGTHAVADLGLYAADAAECPNSTVLELTSLAIPLHNRMTEADYTYVVEALSSVS